MDQPQSPSNSGQEDARNNINDAPIENPKNSHDHTEDRDHRRIERWHWRIDSVIGFVASIGIVFTVGLGIYSVILGNRTLGEATRQARAAEDTLTLAFPPKLSVFGIHIWNGSKKKISEGNPPDIQIANDLHGIAYIINKGRESAIITDSDFYVEWRCSAITIYNPMWKNHTENPLRDILPDKNVDDTRNVISLLDPKAKEPGRSTSVSKLLLVPHSTFSEE